MQWDVRCRDIFYRAIRRSGTLTPDENICRHSKNEKRNAKEVEPTPHIVRQLRPSTSARLGSRVVGTDHSQPISGGADSPPYVGGFYKDIGKRKTWLLINLGPAASTVTGVQYEAIRAGDPSLLSRTEKKRSK